MSTIKYKAGYKYQLCEQFVIKIGVYPRESIEAEFAHLDTDGTLTIAPWYAWDGPSGPPKWLSELPIIGWFYRRFMLPQFMRGSLVHDVLYQLMRHNLLLSEEWRETADRVLQRICLEDGMWHIRAWWVYRGVRRGGSRGASASGRKPVLEAP